MRHVYWELVKEGHEIRHIDSENFEEWFLKYYPFLTSLGVNAYLIFGGDPEGTKCHVGSPSLNIRDSPSPSRSNTFLV